MTKQQPKQRIEILNVKVNNLSKTEVLNRISQYLSKIKSSGRFPQTASKYIVTPYSEFFIKAARDPDFRNILNKAFLSLPDGVFIQWASYYNSLLEKYTFRPQNLLAKFANLCITVFLYCVSGAMIILKPSKVKSIINERIPGSVFVYDLVNLSAVKGYKIAILGGYDFGSGNTGVLAANLFKQKHPELEIVEIYPGTREKEEFGEKVVQILKESNADILLCAYGPVRQEKWLAQNLSKTGIPLAIGLGGTLDYVSGAKKLPPKWIRKIGLEWFFRPFFAEGLNPKRFIKRLMRAWPAMIVSSILVLEKNLQIYVF
ncbi:hypothetical protein GF357_03490 [Candidatus Dojkabacteria bacterium]|nr:hypothetical protein [Candidatus Dojkabacteria bacterium]